MPGVSPSPAPNRAAQYNAKLVPAQVSAYITARKGQMSFSLARYLAKEAHIRSLIGGLLSGVSMPSYKIANYMAAGLHMWKIFNKLGGSTAGRNEIAYVIATWTSRGLTAARLADVRNIVTGCPVP
jgi:hypothetical protein